MKRIALHHNWSFLDHKKNKWYPAKVPGCIHSDLRRNKLIPDPFWGNNEQELQWIEEQDWSYRCEFNWHEKANYEETDLVAEGLDTLAEIRLNGQLLGKTENMFCRYRFSVGKKLKPGKNLIEVSFASPMPYIRERQKKHDGLECNDRVGGSSTIRKEQCSFGWDWGPRFATSGIYKTFYLESWNVNRLDTVRVDQSHAKGKVTLRLDPEPARKVKKATYHSRLTFDGKLVAESEALELHVNKPQLWWPNGHGKQPLYELQVSLIIDGKAIDTWKRRIGLRTIKLDRHKDEFGESFQFLVNDKAIFAKGANWIPAHSFVTELTRKDYDDLLSSAAFAHMNMIRVWGGGIYEADEFYELCDEKGLLVWQDFMFACALYPGDRQFLALVKTEAEQQIRRLRHHASLALWCGNNELESLGKLRRRMEEKASYKKNYKRLFHEILPDIVARNTDTDYWPSSPHNPDGGLEGIAHNPNAGDAHFWQVWHARKPVKDYEKTGFRFCSEFGMQSYPAPEVAETFCPPDELNIFSPIFENHQKNGGGNGTIFHYVSQRYRFPNDYRALAYLSQVNQAYCMKIGIEHWRRLMPRSMGALYWQLNDCWPVCSWSSIDFGGRWKALQHESRRFFAPALVTAHVPGEVTFNGLNIVKNTIDEIDIYTVYDGIGSENAVLRWTLFDIREGMLLEDSKKVKLSYGQAKIQKKLRAGKWMQQYGAERLIMRLRLEGQDGDVISENTVFFSLPRLMELPKAKIKMSTKLLENDTFAIKAVSKVFQHQVQFSLKGLPNAKWDTNFIDLFPGAETTITVDPGKNLTAADFKKRLNSYSMVDAYA